MAVRHRMLASTTGVALLAGALTLSAGVGTAAAATSKAQVQATCLAVGAVLSDGPDPGADAVGYAEAQILPLHQIKTSDPALKKAIDNLDSAYQSFYKTKGGPAAKKSVNSAVKKMNAICPGTAGQ